MAGCTARKHPSRTCSALRSPHPPQPRTPQPPLIRLQQQAQHTTSRRSHWERLGSRVRQQAASIMGGDAKVAEIEVVEIVGGGAVPVGQVLV